MNGSILPPRDCAERRALFLCMWVGVVLTCWATWWTVWPIWPLPWRFSITSPFYKLNSDPWIELVNLIWSDLITNLWAPTSDDWKLVRAGTGVESSQRQCKVLHLLLTTMTTTINSFINWLINEKLFVSAYFICFWLNKIHEIHFAIFISEN